MKSKNVYKEYNSGLKISSIKEALVSIDKLKNMKDKAKARKLAKVMSLRALGNRTQDKEKQKNFKIVSAMYLKQSRKFQDGGLADIKNKVFSNPVLGKLLNKDNYDIIIANKFRKEQALNHREGAGLEFWANDDDGAPDFPHPSKGKYVSELYNSSGQNESTIFRDILHVLPKDPEYNKMREDFKQNFLPEEMEFLHKKHKRDDPETDFNEWLDRTGVDAYIRGGFDEPSQYGDLFKKEGHYSPKQKEIIKQMRTYVGFKNGGRISYLQNGNVMPESLNRKSVLTLKPQQIINLQKQQPVFERSEREQDLINEGYLGSGQKGSPSGMAMGKAEPDDTFETVIAGAGSLAKKGIQKVATSIASNVNYKKIPKVLTGLKDKSGIDESIRKFKHKALSVKPNINNQELEALINKNLSKDGFSDLSVKVKTLPGKTGNIKIDMSTGGYVTLQPNYPYKTPIDFLNRQLSKITTGSNDPQFLGNQGLKKFLDFPNFQEQRGAAANLHNSVNQFLKGRQLGNVLSGGGGHSESGLARWQKLVDRNIAERIGNSDMKLYKLKKHGGTLNNKK